MIFICLCCFRDEVDGLFHIQKSLERSITIESTHSKRISSSVFSDETDDVDRVTLSRRMSDRAPETIAVDIDGFKTVEGLTHTCDVTKLIRLTSKRPKEQPSVKYDVVYKVDVEHGRKSIRFESPLQVA